MTVSTSPIPATIEIRRSRLLGLLAAVAVAAAAITGSVIRHRDHGSGSARGGVCPLELSRAASGVASS